MALRVRDCLRDLCAEEAGRPVLLVAHDTVVVLLRYVLERLTEQRLPELAPVLNCSASVWRPANGRLQPELWNATGHLA